MLLKYKVDLCGPEKDRVIGFDGARRKELPRWRAVIEDCFSRSWLMSRVQRGRMWRT